MSIRIFLTVLAVLFLSSCSSSRRVNTKKREKVTTVELKPKKLTSVQQHQLVRKLERKEKKLNKYTLQYIEKYAPLAVFEMHEHHIPASITLAQGILESGNGRSWLASKSNNHFGIKCHTVWKGQKVYYDDDKKGECFRKYKYVQTSYKDHSKFLSEKRRYANLFTLRKTDYKGWARGLKKAGYATDKQYAEKLIKIIQDYQLYEFDQFSKKDIRRSQKQEKQEEVVVQHPNYSIPDYYTVEKGDTLYVIAKKFHTTVAKLKEVNGLKSNVLSIGQKLLTK